MGFLRAENGRVSGREPLTSRKTGFVHCVAGPVFFRCQEGRGLSAGLVQGVNTVAGPRVNPVDGPRGERGPRAEARGYCPRPRWGRIGIASTVFDNSDGL